MSLIIIQMVEINTNEETFSHLPTTTGTCSFKMGEESISATLEDLMTMEISGNEVFYFDQNGVSTNNKTYLYTITITGGEDADNPNLINWLQTNATRVE